MRTRELLLATVLAALGACVSNPDPRSPTLRMVEREGFGGYIVLTLRSGQTLQGELISVEPTVIRVLALEPTAAHPLMWVATTDVTRAELYEYESEAGFGLWGTLGTLSTASHGFFLIFSAPIWLITSGIAASTEASHILLEYPKASWADIAKWARFPQGMPPGLDEEALTVPLARRAPRPAEPPSGAVPPPPPPPPAPPAPPAEPAPTP